jgi:hypothetical protein
MLGIEKDLNISWNVERKHLTGTLVTSPKDAIPR